MARLVPCGHCHVHVRSNERTCPHCAAPIERGTGKIAATAAAALMTLAATACEKNGPGPIEPMYGAPVVDDVPPGDSSGDPGDPGDPGDSGDPVAEPEYGVPVTDGIDPDGPDAAPMYGVPMTEDVKSPGDSN